MKKFKSLASTHIKKSILLLVISSMSAFMLCSCGNNEDSASVETDVIEENSASTETDATVEPTAELTEIATSTETEEPVEDVLEETVDLPSDEYLVDYPLVSGDTKIYIKLPDNFVPRENEMNMSGYSYKEWYDEFDKSTVYLFADTNTNFDDSVLQGRLTYSIVTDTSEHTADWYEAHKDTGDPQYTDITSYNITSETFDNGITFYEVQYVFSDFIGWPEYFVEYTTENNITIHVLFEINDITKVVDFYRTTNDAFVIK